MNDIADILATAAAMIHQSLSQHQQLHLIRQFTSRQPFALAGQSTSFIITIVFELLSDSGQPCAFERYPLSATMRSTARATRAAAVEDLFQSAKVGHATSTARHATVMVRPVFHTLLLAVEVSPASYMRECEGVRARESRMQISTCRARSGIVPA